MNSNDMVELLPCPFCGGEAFRADGGTCFIGCSSSTEECPVSPTVRSFGNASAAVAWYTRAVLAAHAGQVERLREALVTAREAICELRAIREDEECAEANVVRASGAAGEYAMIAIDEALSTTDSQVSDLPRLIELQRTAAPEDEREEGWNAGLDRAAAMIRYYVANAPSRSAGR